jgi:hypothetical protein
MPGIRGPPAEQLFGLIDRHKQPLMRGWTGRQQIVRYAA